MTQQTIEICIGAPLNDEGFPEGLADDALQPDVGPELEIPVSAKEKVADFVADLNPTGPNVIRGIPLFTVQQLLPRLWIRQYGCKCWHVLRNAVAELDEFWSHGWRTATWQKYVNVLILVNGFAALLVSNLAAVLACVLVMLGILPTGWRHHGSKWCSSSGILAYHVVLLCNRRGKIIFLDITSTRRTPC
eukprot:s132_g5.t1